MLNVYFKAKNIAVLEIMPKIKNGQRYIGISKLLIYKTEVIIAPRAELTKIANIDISPIAPAVVVRGMLYSCFKYISLLAIFPILKKDA